ncbi:MAG TPA: hypothetical protein VF092_15680 [Longimicrobium sp.]
MRTAAPRLSPILLLLPLSACMTWRGQPIPAGPGQHDYIVGTARVIRTDGMEFLLDNVSVRPDSVVGAQHVPPARRIAIPTAEVARIDARREDPFGTALAVALGTAAALGAFGMALFLIYGTGG